MTVSLLSSGKVMLSRKKESFCRLLAWQCLCYRGRDTESAVPCGLSQALVFWCEGDFLVGREVKT